MLTIEGAGDVAMTSKAFRTATAMVAGLLVVACSTTDNEVAPITFDSVAVVAPPSTATSVQPTTTMLPTTTPSTVAATEPPTTVAADTTTVVGPTEGPMFSDALGIKVETAPGVHTRGDTRQLLPEGLYVHLAWEPDPNDPSVFTVQPDDIPILEAYSNASLAYYRAVITVVAVDPTLFAPFMIDSGAEYENSFEEARAGGLVGSLGSGVVLRPYVLADHRDSSSATILDCYLQNEQLVLRDGGQPELEPLEAKGTVATMKLTNSGWKVDIIASEPGACV